MFIHLNVRIVFFGNWTTFFMETERSNDYAWLFFSRRSFFQNVWLSSSLDVVCNILLIININQLFELLFYKWRTQKYKRMLGFRFDGRYCQTHKCYRCTLTTKNHVWERFAQIKRLSRCTGLFFPVVPITVRSG